MSWSRKQYITVFAIVLFVATAPLLWQIADVRATHATEEQQADLTNQKVAERQTVTDYDGDGINDSSDKCPTRPETENGYQDSDGCPDVVETTGAS